MTLDNDTNKKLLLHVCCGPCATSSIERLLEDGWEVDLFYCNSNISPKTEWDKRLEGVDKVASYFNLKWFSDEYTHSIWLDSVKGYENEPEKGSRCSVCFDFSFKRASEAALKGYYQGFSTTLTVSPHKNSKIIFDLANGYGNFIEYNFKKRDGYKRSLELSNKLGLYRQNYCGCEFSIR
ncbi:MAG: epoxyqueuosine reductase QueH [Spirochaetales bacterium]|nr:epoxyqueuosine reductase QueH [Spirochaetales bacterium]